MNDWQGNKIKIGDELVIIDFKDIFGGQKMGIMMINKEGEMSTLVEPTKTDYGFKWEIHRTIKVMPYGGMISNNEVPVNLLDPFAAPNSMNQCLCIKGKSDNQKEFMDNYLK